MNLEALDSYKIIYTKSKPVWNHWGGASPEFTRAPAKRTGSGILGSLLFLSTSSLIYMES